MVSLNTRLAPGTSFSSSSTSERRPIWQYDKIKEPRALMVQCLQLCTEYLKCLVLVTAFSAPFTDFASSCATQCVDFSWGKSLSYSGTTPFSLSVMAKAPSAVMPIR